MIRQFIQRSISLSHILSTEILLCSITMQVRAGMFSCEHRTDAACQATQHTDQNGSVGICHVAGIATVLVYRCWKLVPLSKGGAFFEEKAETRACHVDSDAYCIVGVSMQHADPLPHVTSPCSDMDMIKLICHS